MKPSKRDPKLYVERVVQEDYGQTVQYLADCIALAHGRAPPSKDRPFTNYHRWRDGATRLLNDAVPEATRAVAAGYAAFLISYIAAVYFGRRRIDNYYHDDAARQIRARRRAVRQALERGHELVKAVHVEFSEDG